MPPAAAAACAPKNPCSPLALRIVRAAVDPDVSLAELAEYAQGDPALAVRVLSVVNTAAYSPSKAIVSVNRAACMLGVRGLRNVALGFAVGQMAPPGADGLQLLTISLRRGVAARLIAETIGVKSGVDDYFTAGLLLESGLLASAAEDPQSAGRFAMSPAMSRCVQERANGQLSHPERGALLGEEWHLGEELTRAVRSHHDPSPPAQQLAHVAWLAERLAAVLEGGDLFSVRMDAVAAAETLGIDEGRVDAILEQLPSQTAAAASLMERDVGPQPDFEQLRADAAKQLMNLNQSFNQMIQRLERTLRERDEATEALRRANEQLEQAAATDGLTGLANHRTFQHSLRRDMSRASRSRKPMSLVMIDVDHFKKLNDTHGHPAGDAVLRAIARVLKENVRTGDVAARYGGEEFALILPDTDGPGATLVAERVRGVLEKMNIKLRGKRVRVTASLGVTTATTVRGQDDAEALVVEADGNLYKAKNGGRNRVVHSEMNLGLSLEQR